MAYRVCVNFIPGSFNLEDPLKWEKDQVHEEYPKATGTLSQHFYGLFLTTMLGNRPPNISVVSESMAESGCYQSIRNNKSDITPFLIGYPIKDYKRVNPVQPIFQGPLIIMSTYKVDDSFSIIYADILRNSMKAFDIVVWTAVVVSFLVFSGLLSMRKRINSKKGIKNQCTDSPIFETFRHFIGQESSSFSDRTGKVISFTMTLGFFFIIAFFCGLMSTELVVVTKPFVIRNYRDVIHSNKTVCFAGGMNNSDEFKDARQGSVQSEFWKMTKNRVVVVDTNNFGTVIALMIKILKQKAVLLLNSYVAIPMVDIFCKEKYIVKENVPEFTRTYAWTSSDPESKIHTRGIIMRQGLETPLITRGVRRLRGLFEGDIPKIAIHKGMDSVDLGSIFSGTDYSDRLKCLSKTVNYNEVKVERVVVENFKCLYLLCLFMMTASAIVLLFENGLKSTKPKYRPPKVKTKC